MSKLIVVDVESDGPVPGIDMYSMICFGAVLVDKNGKLDKTFYGKTAPISNKYDENALSISGFTREEHKTFENPKEVMIRFKEWVNGIGNCIFISDNPCYDWSFINYYFHKFTNGNPFGYSGQRIGDKFQGFYNDSFYKWEKHRITKHTHNPVDDAKGNAEALLYLYKQGYKLF